MNRAFTNILTDDVEQTCRFYEALLGLERRGDFGWFILLGHDAMPGFELGILDKGHDTVPMAAAGARGGTILTFVVDDIETAFKQAQAIAATILQPPTPLPYGQTRLLLSDPAGTMVDISAPTP